MVFLRLLRYVRRTIVRAKLRSMLTIVGTALAMGLFAFVWMLERGVDDLAEAADQPVLVVFQSSRFCPLTSELPMRYVREIEEMEGVRSVLPTLVYINSCRANLDLVTLHGIPTAGMEDVHDLDMLAGGMEAWQADERGALVGRRLAARRGLSVGDRVQLSNVDVRVAGIFESESAGLDNVAFVRIQQLQNARKQQGLATQILVRMDEGVDAEALAERIDERYAGERQATDTKTMQAFVQGAVGEVGEVVDFARLLGYLAVGVVVLILATTVSISAQTRTTEMGVMETLGVTRATIGGLVLVESVLLALLGGLLGIGVVAIWFYVSPQTLGIEGWGVNIGPDPSLFVAGLVVSAIVGVVAAVGPALQTANRNLALAVKPD